MKKELYAVCLILIAFFSGMIVTAATSAYDGPESPATAIGEDKDGPASPVQAATRIKEIQR
jgi:hypothetical protein